MSSMDDTFDESPAPFLGRGADEDTAHLEDAAATPEVGPKCGTVALVGRPNAGKSTLLNQLLEEKLAIVSDKPQTTRHRLVGILSNAEGQIVFYDTPGVHRPQHQMNRNMVKAAQEALNDADVVCLLVDVSQKPGRGDQFMLEWVAQTSTPKIVVLNKIDLVDKTKLLPRIAMYAEKGFATIVPISAMRNDGCERVLQEIWPHLPEGSPTYDPELLSIHPERFLVAERIREKVLHQTRDELPFSVAVVVESWEERSAGLIAIYASILVEREGQKKIVIGAKGRGIKNIGMAARHDLESYLGCRLFLDLKVRVEKDWRENRRILSELDRAPYEVGE